MTTRHLSRFIIGAAVLVLTSAMLFNGSTSSAAGKGDRTPPTTPNNLVVTAITDSSITVSWQGSTDNSGSLSYRLKITNLNNSIYNSVATINGGQTTYTAKFLPSNNNFTFNISAVDAAGNKSGDSNTASGRTLGDTTPPTGLNLQASSLGPSQVQLTWTRPTDSIPNNCCAYSFVMNGSPLTQNINWANAPAGSLSVIIRHLHPGTTNSFNVKASDYNGNTATSNTVSATTLPSSDTTPPSVPNNLHFVSENGCAEVYLGWTQATDNSDSQDAIEYEIYVNGVLSPLPVNHGIDLDFVYGTAFGDNIFTVRAVDRAGNSSADSGSLKLFLWPC